MYDHQAATLELQEMIRQSFEMVQRRIEFFYRSRERDLALSHLDQAYLHTLHLIRNEQVEVLKHG